MIKIRNCREMFASEGDIELGERHTG